MRHSRSHLRKLFTILVGFLWLGLNQAAEAQTYPPAWSASSTYAAGDIVQLGGNWYRAVKAVTANGASPVSNYASWELNFVRSNTTLMIGGGQIFPTLDTAWKYALNARVADGEYLHLYISTAKSAYNETLSAPFLLDHSSGARMAILGDNVGDILLQFQDTNGFIIDTGHSFNTISGVSLYNDTPSNHNDGVKASLQAAILSLSNIGVRGFYNEIHVSQGASVTLSSNVVFGSTEHTEVLAETMGTVYIPTTITINQPGTNSEYGLLAQYGGVIYAQNSITISGYAYGAATFEAGILELNSATISSCTVGCEAQARGIIALTGGSVTGSTQYDLEADQGGYIYPFNTTYNSSLSNFANDGSYIY